MRSPFAHIIIGLTTLLLSCSNDQISRFEPNISNPALNKEEPFQIPKSNTLGVIKHKNKSDDGFTLFTIYKDTYLIDLCGRVINHWISDYERGGAFTLLEDGSLLRAGKVENQDLAYGGIGGIIEKFGWDGNLEWHYIYSSPQFSQHHGMVELPNGNILLLAAHRMTGLEALLAGRNPANISEGELFDEQIIEVKPYGTTGGEIVWQWKVWDHLIQEFDTTKANFGAIIDNPQRIDINFLGTSNGKKDWLHMNALHYNENLDQLIISSQKLSELYIIDHSTSTLEAASHFGGNSGKGGDILYRWGNPLAYGHGSEDARQLFGQHNPHWIPAEYPDGGKILIFNNGLGRTSNYSSIDIIAPAMDNPNNYQYTPFEAYGPNLAEWTYTNNEDPLLFYSRILSSAQRLSNGNTLVCEGTQGKFFEFDSDGEIVWEYITPVTSDGTVLTQGDLPSSNIFQVIRYSKGFSGFLGKNLTPGNPIELDFDLGNCK